MTMGVAGELPDEQTWERAGHQAERAVKQALFDITMQILKREKDARLTLPIGMAAIGVAAEFLGQSIEPGNAASLAHLERMAIGYLRAGLRGIDHPIHEDGRAMTGGLDA